MNELVSVIMPVFNDEKNLSSAISSVITQTYENWELLIVNDGSTDQSQHIIACFAEKDERIRAFHTDRSSGSPTKPRNIGLQHARGRYIAFLDSDDQWVSTKLEHQIALFDQNSDALVVYANYDVMKESAVLALEYLKAHSSLLSIDNDLFENYNIHIHVPEGAVPKDGPSAGITIATSIASALTQRKVRKNLAMTGEITLRGKVLPVGGIKEKILAAKRAGIKEIILSRENEKNIHDIPEQYVKGLTFHYVDTIEEVLSYALLDEKVKNAITFKIQKPTNK